MADREARREPGPVITIYLEGGGHGGEGRRRLGRAMEVFLRKVTQRKLRVFPLGGRSEVIRQFRKHASTEEVRLLLVDSEQPVQAATPAGYARHLASEGGLLPEPHDHLHLMIQCMESWLIADRDAWERLYGPDAARALPGTCETDDLEKRDVLSAVQRALELGSRHGRYRKLEDGPKVLERLDPNAVARRSRSFRALRDWLTSHDGA